MIKKLMFILSLSTISFQQLSAMEGSCCCKVIICAAIAGAIVQRDQLEKEKEEEETKKLNAQQKTRSKSSEFRGYRSQSMKR